MKKLIAALMILAAPLMAAPPTPYPITVDSQVNKQPALTVFRSNKRTIRVTFQDGGTATDLTGATVQFSWAINANANAITTGTVATVGSTTGGVVDATFSAADLNQTAGRYIWEALVTDSNSAIATFAQGRLTIKPSPAATGTNAVPTLSVFNWDNIDSYNGTWPISGGTNIVVVKSTTGIVVNATVSDTDSNFTNTLAVSGGNLSLTGGATSGNNTIGLTTNAMRDAVTNSLGSAAFLTQGTNAAAQLPNFLQTTNLIVALDTDTDTKFTNTVAVSGALLTLSGGATSGNNTFGLTTGAVQGVVTLQSTLDVGATATNSITVSNATVRSLFPSGSIDFAAGSGGFIQGPNTLVLIGYPTNSSDGSAMTVWNVGSANGSRVTSTSDETTGGFQVFDGSTASQGSGTLLADFRNSTHELHLTNSANLIVDGTMKASGITYPAADGSAGQTVQTDGAGTMSFITRRFQWGGSDPVPTNGGTLRYIPSEVFSEKVDLRWMSTQMTSGALGFSLASQYWTNALDNFVVLADINATTTAASNSLASITITNLYRLLIVETNNSASSTQFIFSVQGDYNP